MSRASAVAAGAALSTALLVLIGWTFDIEMLMTVLGVPMEANAAVAFLALAIAILVEFTGRPAWIRRTAAGLAFALGSLTLFQYITGIPLYIDEVFFRDPLHVDYPGRLALPTAANLTVLGLALMLPSKQGSRKRARVVLSLIVSASSLLAIVGYLYGVPLLHGSMHHSAMALHTGISLLLLSLASVFVDQTAAVARLIRSDLAGGVFARRLLPVAIVVPLFLGFIFVNPMFNFDDPRMGVALQAMASVVVFAVIISGICTSLNLVSRARLMAERSLMLDQLTGIFNRRYFDRRIADSMVRSQRYGAPLSLILFDADHFKSVNDIHGHLAGDEVLRAMGSLVARSLRTSDVVCRYGGEEFALILPETPAEEAEIIAERIRKAVAAGVEKEVGIKVTISLGITTLGLWDDEPHELIARADLALYEAKAAGRDCFRTVRPETDRGRTSQRMTLVPAVAAYRS